ncbi:hypothetical protein THOG11_140123 [Vibrio harveyi]|nr:hypothetical protein TH15OA1_480065 [Vibrio harveyi]CAH1538148.1 hypothetical protein VHARVF571_460062 [Vibrio harveyi]CAH1555649.1 hypothetical protein THOG11_140123 [Vibrio harveyi]
MTEPLHTDKALMVGLNSGFLTECVYAYQTSQLSRVALMLTGFSGASLSRVSSFDLFTICSVDQKYL